MKKKKPFYKRWWVWILAIIIVGGMASGGDEEEVVAENDQPKETVESAKAEESKSKEEPKDEPKEESKPKEEEKTYGIGDEVTVKNLTYKVNGIEETNTISSILGDKTTEGKYIIVDLTVGNKDKKARYVDGQMLRVLVDDGTEYSSDSELDMYVNEDIGFFLASINPNLTQTGKVVFELPKSAEKFELQVSSGFGWSGGEYVNIKLK